ncbi:MAG: hypothetical protein GC152_14555 [Alphaproteobacteria bacterium]|nr:hypothetical protein [Alphaproteobacteria bacterium]
MAFAKGLIKKPIAKKPIAGMAACAAAAVGLGIGFGLSGAAAQTANALNANLQTISAADVAQMLTEFEISSEMRAAPSGAATPVLLAETGGGGRFLVSFLKCANPAQAAGCSQATITTAQSSSGVAYDDLNRFNGESTVTRVVYDASQQLLIFGRNIVMPGGVGRDNFKLQVALFLHDMGKFVSSRSAAGIAVSFNRTPSLKGKIDSAVGASSSDESSAIVAVGAKAARDLEIEIAIDNATGVSFDFANSPLD